MISYPTYHTTPYHITPYHTIPYPTLNTISYHTIPYHMISHHTIPCHTVPHHATPHHTTPYRTNHAIRYHIIPCYAMPYSTQQVTRARKSCREKREPKASDVPHFYHKSALSGRRASNHRCKETVPGRLPQECDGATSLPPPRPLGDLPWSVHCPQFHLLGSRAQTRRRMERLEAEYVQWKLSVPLPAR